MTGKDDSPETKTMNAMELVRRAFEKYKDHDETDLRALREGLTKLLDRASSVQRVQLAPRKVTAEILHELKTGAHDFTPTVGEFRQMLSSDFIDRAVLAREVASTLGENEKRVTRLTNEVARREGKNATGDAVRQMFREAGYRGTTQGEGKRRQDFEELMELVRFALRMEDFHAKRR